MSNNTALIFGQVSDSASGAPMAKVDVSLNFLVGDASLAQVRVGGNDDLTAFPKRATTNSDGRYVLGFFWEAVDIGKVAQGFATASVLAMNWLGTSYTAMNQRGKMFLTLDLRKLIAQGYSGIPASSPDMANIAKDFYSSYKGILKDHQVFYPNTPLLSTEVVGLMAEIDIQMPSS